MFDKILACLDGSPSAEKILPLAQGVAKATGATLCLLRVVEDSKEMSTQEHYMRRRADLFGAQIRFLLSPDPAAAIVEELSNNPHAIVAMTTHGRTAWAEVLVGSVGLKVIRGAKKPVLLYRPLPGHLRAAPKIAALVIALDGSEFSEKIIPFATDMAKSLRARLLLVQAQLQQQAFGHGPSDVLESSYVHAKADEIRKKYAIEAEWDVLHGEAGDAICRYLHGMQDTLLAMTSHARGGIEKAFFGSVAASCIRHAGVPVLIYWPKD